MIGPPLAICDATVRAGRYDAIASVVRNNNTSAPSASATTAMTWPGVGRLERVREQQQRVRGAGVPDGRGEVVDQRGLGRAQPARDRAHRAGVHPGDDEPVDSDRPPARPASTRAFHACSTSGAYVTSPNFSSHDATAAEPGVRQRSMNSSVALAAPRNSAMTGSSSPPTSMRGRAVAALRFVGARRQPAPHVGRDDEHRAAVVERGAQRADTRAQRAAEVERGDVAVEPQRGVHRRRVVLVEVRRVGRREPQRRSASTAVLRSARRAASTPIVVVSSSYPATARVPLPPPDPNVAAIC